MALRICLISIFSRTTNGKAPSCHQLGACQRRFKETLAQSQLFVLLAFRKSSVLPAHPSALSLSTPCSGVLSLPLFSFPLRSLATHVEVPLRRSRTSRFTRSLAGHASFVLSYNPLDCCTRCL
ncbi:hypothetical protein TGPRC2_424640 [Toxoplasma gondii TgCatPRC2]|uniref:Uncharacterized protein n=1 Tax=Toxoplasma gondii TgCatPRC2 TaxID=1130821 RepID=A0A151HFT9_TOXGO|nr:hypothetical protein TGPRC2_424640 [Toxoplasma gondii TgCatPRC2]